MERRGQALMIIYVRKMTLLRILRMVEDAFSLDVAYVYFCMLDKNTMY